MLKNLIIVQAILLAFQIIFYFGCEMFQHRIHDVKRPIDDRIPFLPWTVLPYCFWFPLIALYPIFLYKASANYYCIYLMTMLLEIIVSVVFYMVYPTSFQRPVPPNTFWGNFMKFVYHGSYRGLNCAPSLHCSSCYLIISASCLCSGMTYHVRIISIVIAVMIVLSTMTTKQHTVIDVVTAFPLFLACNVVGMILANHFYEPIISFITNGSIS